MDLTDLFKDPKIGDDCYTVSRKGLVATVRKHRIVGLLEHKGEIFILTDESLQAIPREGYDEDEPGFIARDHFFTNYKVNLDLMYYLNLEEAEAKGIIMVRESRNPKG